MTQQTTAESLLARHGWRLNLAAYAHIMSGRRWLPYRHAVYTAEAIQWAITTPGARLIVEEPPRHGKSELASKWAPTWHTELFPERSIILASYADSLASNFGRKVRNELEENPLATVRLADDRTRANDWVTSEGGGMRTAGIGGGITGFGFHVGIIDDYFKNWEEAQSAARRELVIDWFESTFMTRAEPDASVILNATRWHPNDLTGYVLATQPGKWRRVTLPALAEDGDLLGRAVGEALCPERYDVPALADIRGSMHERKWLALYQQRPTRDGGNIFRRDWFKYWLELPPEFDLLVQSWDMTFKETGSSWVVGQLWGTAGANFYLIDQVRARWDFPATLAQVKAKATPAEVETARIPALWRQASARLVEDAANGPAIISSLRQSVPGIIAIRPGDLGSKAARAYAASPTLEAGNVHIPHPQVARWVEPYIEEHTVFTGADGEENDQVDATTQAINWLRLRVGTKRKVARV